MNCRFLGGKAGCVFIPLTCLGIARPLVDAGVRQPPRDVVRRLLLGVRSFPLEPFRQGFRYLLLMGRHTKLLGSDWVVSGRVEAFGCRLRVDARWLCVEGRLSFGLCVGPILVPSRSVLVHADGIPVLLRVHTAM